MRIPRRLLARAIAAAALASSPLATSAATAQAVGATGTILDDRPMQAPPETRFVVANDGSALDLPKSTPRLALLIGNQTYDTAPPDPAAPLSESLGKLETPCSDVKAIAGRLHDMGWRKSEIIVLCEQGNRQINDALSSLLAVAPLGDQGPRLMMVYLAGHGMSIDGRNYFFGVDTRIDHADKAARAIAGISQGQAYTLFSAKEAVDLYDAVSRFQDEDHLGFPLLIMLDACRNNPFLAYLNRSVDDALKHPSSDTVTWRRYWTMLRKEIAAPRASRQHPEGLEIVYATQAGDTVPDDDGTGSSRLAHELATKVARDVAIRQQFLGIRRDFVDENKNLAASARRVLDWEGDLYSDGEWCFNGCAKPGDDDHVAVGPNTGRQYAAVDRARLPGVRWQTDAPASPGPSAGSPAAAAAVVRRFETHARRKVLVDIFWCSGDAHAEQRRTSATGVADGLAAALEASNLAVGASGIYAVRTRELTAAENAEPSRQRSIDALYVDPVGKEPDENGLAVRFLKPLLPGVAVRGTDRPTRDYIEVSFCAGAFTGASAPRVYVQVATRPDSPLASRMMSVIRRSSPDLAIEPDIEAVLDRPGYPADAYPKTTQVRVGLSDLLPRARALADDLSRSLGTPVRTICIRKCAAPDGKANIEVWIGSAPDASNRITNAVEPFSGALRRDD